MRVQLEIMKTNKETTTTKTNSQGKPDSHEQVFTVKENQKISKKDVIYFAVPFLPVEGKQASSVFLFCVL